MFNFLKDFGVPAHVVAIITLITLLYKAVKKFQKRNLKTTKERLDSIISLFADKEAQKDKFIVEQVFQYKFKSYIPAKVIFCLLDTDSPTSSIKNYILGKRHLKYEFNDSDLSYRGKMENPNHRQKWGIFNKIGYLIFAFMGVGLLYSLSIIYRHLGFPWLITLIPFILYFLWIAYEFLLSALSIRAAERIMNELDYKVTHNNAINLDS